MNEQPSIAAAMAEANLLTNADVFCFDAESGKITYTKAAYLIAEQMVSSFAARYPEEAKKSPFFQTMFLSVKQGFDFITEHVLPHDSKLELADWHRQHIDPSLKPIISGDGSVRAYLDYLQAHRGLLDANVSQYWQPEVIRFHRENNGDCSAKGGCPSTSCSAKALVEAARQRGLVQ